MNITTIDKLAPIITRIIMRYLAGIIGTTSLIAQTEVQAVVALAVAGVLAAVAEIWHARVTVKR